MMQRVGSIQRACARGMAVLAVFLLAAAGAWAQAARFVGSITAIDGTTLTVRTDAGAVERVTVPATAVLQRIAPGERDLSKAEPLDFGGLTVGDRVLVALAPAHSGAVPEVARMIAIQKADLAQMQAAEEAAWSRGVHGLVKSVDTATGAIVVTERVGLAAKEVTVQTTAATVLKRYAPGSVRFSQAQPAPLAAIHPGDQLWARGAVNASGGSFAANAIVSGSFRSIPGVVTAVDVVASTLTVKDLSTKKALTVRVGADAELRRLDTAVATRLAALLKGNAAGRTAATGPESIGPAAGRSGPRGFSPGGAGNGRMGFEAILDRAPVLQLGDLKKGDAVMIVAAEDAKGLNAVKLLAGVEPLLAAPEAQNLLSSWSLSSGESESAQ